MRSSTFWQSMRCALCGLRYLLVTQRNARIHFVIAAMVIAIGVWLGLEAIRWSVLALTIGFVITAEAGNTVAETIVDLVMPDHNENAKIAKDVAAAAVLMTALTSIVVGLLVLGPPICQRLGWIS